MRKTIVKPTKINVPQNLIDLAQILKCKGSLYIVGGYVRNSILGICATDIDLASSITPDELKELLSGTKFLVKEKSKKLGTMEILVGDGSLYEYSTFRSEVYTDDGTHTPISVEFTSDIREDAKRRDFTMNAIYYDILREEFIDIYSGIYDIQKHLIKCIETPEYVFEHDGLRILRFIRLASELNFRYDWSTYVKAKKMSYRLRDISGTRKYEELCKIINSSQKYEISNKKAYYKGVKMFNVFSLWSHFYVPVNKVKLKLYKKASKNLRFVALLIDIINAYNPDCVEYYLNYLLGQKGLALPQKKSANIIKVVCGYFDAMNGVNNKKYFFKYFNFYSEISELVRLSSKTIFSKYQFFYRYVINHKLPITIKDLKIEAQDIKKLFPKVQEKKYGQILNDLLSKVFEGEIENNRDELIKEIKQNVSCGNY